MHIRQTKKTVKGKTCTRYLPVESVATPKGPRQRTICTLGNLAPRPAEQWLKLAHKIESALAGGYLLKTSRTGLSAEELWSIYMLLTRAENAFRSMKSPLAERPIFHQLQHRVETHIFLCVLAYHLLAAIEKTLLDKGVHGTTGSAI